MNNETPTTTPPPINPTPLPPQLPASPNTRALVSLVLGILSLVCCGLFSGLPAVFLGRSELKAIDQGRAPESNRNLAKLGFILGLVGTILSLAAFTVYFIIFGFALMQGTGPKTF
jgi:hypothetical protein